MRKFTLAALTVFFAVGLSAQNKCTVSGYIRDAATGETLIGAGVMVMVTDAASGGEDLWNIVRDESHSDDTRCECFRYKV